ncbi:F-box-like domain superfamily [Sesbania bispinosa]|nr:F-box-like domain superfamily [Sesbania bispinosa]
MKRKRGSKASARTSQRGNRVAVKVDDEQESQQLGPSFFADLPSHITTHILLQLPMKSILICRYVCKSWNALISDPNFAQMHLKRAPVGFLIRTNDPKSVSRRTLHLLEYEPEMFESGDEDQFCCCEDNFLKPQCHRHLKLEPIFKLPYHKTGNGKFDVVNSCNGLLCLCDPKDGDPLVVCNPVTGEFIRLPKATRIDKIHQGPIYAGFGFQPKTNEYKVIRMLHRYVQIPNPGHIREWEWVFEGMDVEMHTLGTSTWRHVGVDPRRFTALRFPTCVNGALHWINYGGKSSILCFNIESERFQPFPSLPHVLENNDEINDIDTVSMGELRGSLYICAASSFTIRTWVMKKYGIGDSWTKVFNIDPMDGDCLPWGLYWPVEHFKKDAAILMYHSRNCFIYYEPKKYGFKIFKVHGTQSNLEVIPHVPSLISLKNAVKGDNIEVLTVHSRCARLKLREENGIILLAKELSSLYSI